LIENSGVVHSKRGTEDIERFRKSEIKYLVNVDMLTTGFNVPDVDCVVVMRATQSPGLWVQMVGRGTRMAHGKENCLVLDFGENTLRHGCIDKINILNPRERKGESTGAPIRECPECHSLIGVQNRFCPDCGYVFLENPRHEDTASEADIISKKLPPEWVDIDDVQYYRHSKDDKPDSMRVEYMQGYKCIVKEFICLEHGGYATRKAVEWIDKRFILDEVKCVDDLLNFSSLFIKPSKILVDYNEFQESEKLLTIDDIPF
jgi:DNA repair protein RadD